MARPDESPLSPPARALGPPPLSNAGEHMSAVSQRRVRHLPRAQKQPAPRARPDTRLRSCP